MNDSAAVLAGRPGVDLRTGARVRVIEPGRVHLVDETIAADTIVLAAGTVPVPVEGARTDSAAVGSPIALVQPEGRRPKPAVIGRGAT